MRVVVILVLLSLGLGVAWFRFRAQAPELAQVMLGFSILFALMLIAAFFNLI